MNLKKILIGVIVIYGVISAWMIGSPYIKNAMFANDLDNIARVLSVDGTIQKAKNQINAAIRYHEIPATLENFTITKNERTRQVLIDGKYSVRIETPFGWYTHVWNFNPRAEKGMVKIPRPGG
jgi:hypothetical protein